MNSNTFARKDEELRDEMSELRQRCRDLERKCEALRRENAELISKLHETFGRSQFRGEF